MIPDGPYTAVVDRIEGGQAVLEVAGDGRERHELVVATDMLPENGRHADAVLTVEIRDGTPIEVAYRPTETRERGERAQSRFDRLSSRPPDQEDDAGAE